jgi:histidinol-phosphate/aromatic aminotransferase/cobyric acid decarboxylase-like protein
MFDRTTSHESSQSRRKSIVEELDDIDSIDEIFKNKNNFLWIKTNRRNKYKSISIHENIIKIMKSYLIAWIIIDRKNTKNWTTWF